MKCTFITLLNLALLFAVVPVSHSQSDNWDSITCIPCEQINDVEWNPSGDRIAIASTHGLSLYNTNFDPRDISLPRTRLTPHGFESYDADFSPVASLTVEPVRDIEWSGDGTLLAANICGMDGERSCQLRVWSLADYEVRLVFDVPTTRLSFSWNPHENVLAFSNDNVMSLWDADTGTIREAANVGVEPASHFLEAWGLVWVVRWSPDGERIAVSTAQQQILIWNHQTETVEMSFTVEQTASDPLEWDPAGKLLLLAESPSNFLFLLDVETGDKTLLELLDDPLIWMANLVAWSPDGTLVATDYPSLGLLAVWDTATWQRLPLDWDRNVDIRALAWSPDSRLLAIGYQDGNVSILRRPQ